MSTKQKKTHKKGHQKGHSKKNAQDSIHNASVIIELEYNRHTKQYSLSFAGKAHEGMIFIS
jgi:hypothetical protein